MENISIEIYEVYTCSDLTEGRGTLVHLGFFKTLKEAKLLAKGKGVQGTDADTRLIKHDYLVFDTCVEFMEHRAELVRRERLREQALSKLTQDEKEALGLLGT